MSSWSIGVLLAGMMIVLAACGARVPAGQWREDSAVAQAFLTGIPLPGHSYYYLGSITAPDAVIAVDNQFTLRTRVWARIEISASLLQGWLNWYRTENPGNCPRRGGVILTPEGVQAGIWYGPDPLNIVEMPEPGVLVIYQPFSPGQARCNEPHEDGPLR